MREPVAVRGPVFASREEVEERARAVSKGEVVKCGCGSSADEGRMICCDACSSWQHMDCVAHSSLSDPERGGVGIFADGEPDEYVCDACARRDGFGIDSRHIVPLPARVHKATSSNAGAREVQTAFVLGQTSFWSDRQQRMAQKLANGHAEGINRAARSHTVGALKRANIVHLDGSHPDRPSYDLLARKAIDIGLPVHDLPALQRMVSSLPSPKTYTEYLQRELAAHCIARHRIDDDKRPWLVDIIDRARLGGKRVNAASIRAALQEVEREHEARMEKSRTEGEAWDLPAFDGSNIFVDECGVVVAYQLGASEAACKSGWVHCDLNSIREYLFRANIHLSTSPSSSSSSKLRQHIAIDDAEHLRSLDHGYQLANSAASGERGQRARCNFYRSNVEPSGPHPQGGVHNHVERAGYAYQRRASRRVGGATVAAGSGVPDGLHVTGEASGGGAASMSGEAMDTFASQLGPTSVQAAAAFEYLSRAAFDVVVRANKLASSRLPSCKSALSHWPGIEHTGFGVNSMAAYPLHRDTGNAIFALDSAVHYTNADPNTGLVVFPSVGIQLTSRHGMQYGSYLELVGHRIKPYCVSQEAAAVGAALERYGVSFFHSQAHLDWTAGHAAEPERFWVPVPSRFHGLDAAGPGADAGGEAEKRRREDDSELAEGTASKLGGHTRKRARARARRTMREGE